MSYRIIPVTPFEQNCTVLWCDETREAVLVDPGGDPERIRQALATTGLTPGQILLTHGHIDHVGAARELANELGIPVVGPHPEDAFLLDSLPLQSQMFGLPRVEPIVPDRWFDAGETLAVGRLRLRVIHCPGHTPGHVALVEPSERLALVGDLLFAGSIGRTDLARGDYGALLDSIRNRLFPLGDDIRFIPGHGPMSSFGEERRSNPFVGGDAV